MDLQEWIHDLRKNMGPGYEAFSKNALGGEPSHQTIKDIETGRSEPRISTLKLIAEKTGQDIHLVAHMAFSLPKPEEFGELDDLLQDLCDRVMSLGEEDRKNVLTYIKMLTRMRKEEGGDAKDHAQETQSGFG